MARFSVALTFRLLRIKLLAPNVASNQSSWHDGKPLAYINEIKFCWASACLPDQTQPQSQF